MNKINFNKMFVLLIFTVLLLNLPFSLALEFNQFIMPDLNIPDVYNPQSLNRYSYVLNNPYKYVDPTGNYAESFLDVGFIILDINDIRNDPRNWVNYLSLSADVLGAALPVFTGGRLLVKGAEKAVDVARTADKISDVSSLIGKTGTYKELSKLTAGKDGVIQAHHIVEKMFIKSQELGKQAIENAPAVILTKEQHQIVTNELRTVMKYGLPQTPESAYKGYQKAYEKYPEHWKTVQKWFKENLNYNPERLK